MKTLEHFGPHKLGLLTCLLFVSMASAQPIWIEQGPGPSPGDGTGGMVCGRVISIAADPSNSNRVFVTGENGGVWRTLNGTAPNPVWTPLTDQFPESSMQSVVFSPSDPSNNTLFAGFVGGILKTIDGGDHWTWLGSNTFSGQTVLRILPTPVSSPSAQTIFAATVNSDSDGPGGGVYRSTDGGQTWEKRSGSNGQRANGLPDYSFVALAEDPGNAHRLFVATDNPPMVFRSENLGTNWTEITSAITGLPNGYNPTKIAISAVPDNEGIHWVYLLAFGAPVFLSKDSGSTWIQMDPLPPDPAHGELVVSPDNVDIVFVQANNPGHYRGDASAAPGTQWYQIDGPNAGGTYAHTDGHDWVFSANRNLMYEANDGGIWRVRNPFSNSPHWETAVGNMRVIEFLSVAYDSVHHIIFGACWDNSIPQQTVPGSIAWENNEDSFGDGIKVDVDITSIPGKSIHYSSQWPDFQEKHFHRREYSSPASATDSLLRMNVVGLNSKISGVDKDNDDVWMLNRAEPTRMLLGTDYLYESTNRGDDFVSLGGLRDTNGDGINDSPDQPVGTVTALAYGHPLDADVFYVGTSGNVGEHLLWVRTSGRGYPTPLTSYKAKGGATPRAVVLHPKDWQTAYVLDNQGQVWRTIDAGATSAGWSNLTGTPGGSGSLSSLAADLRTIELFAPTGISSEEALIVGGYGGVFVKRNASADIDGGWQRFGDNFPYTIVTDLHYNRQDDILLAGTYGRGAWTMPNASTAIFPNDCFINARVLLVGPTAPYQTVRAAYNAAQDCNRILIFTGTYSEAPITMSKHIRLESQGGSATIR